MTDFGLKMNGGNPMGSVVDDLSQITSKFAKKYDESVDSLASANSENRAWLQNATADAISQIQSRGKVGLLHGGTLGSSTKTVGEEAEKENVGNPRGNRHSSLRSTL